MAWWQLTKKQRSRYVVPDGNGRAVDFHLKFFQSQQQQRRPRYIDYDVFTGKRVITDQRPSRYDE
jgi:predicted secreted hydrolase